MRKLNLTAATRAALEAHAAETYPNECCGFVVEQEGQQRAVRVTNIQDEVHARDPQTFPRTARIAYTMGSEAAPVLIDAERGRLRLVAVYHSHPEHEAYFSAEDKLAALGGWDEPNYPDAGQVVMSVRDGQVRYAKAFAWDAASRDYVEIELAVDDHA